MPEISPFEFYKDILDLINEQNDVTPVLVLHGDTFLFRDNETGRFSFAVDVWDYFDTLRKEVGHREAYNLVLGL
jgi:UDP-2,3-diacylglucosamine pyrophosphatase LpxH